MNDYLYSPLNSFSYYKICLLPGHENVRNAVFINQFWIQSVYTHNFLFKLTSPCK